MTFTIKCRETVITFRQPAVMAVLNITPDSFYSASRATTAADFLAAARRLAADGADILDIGAASSRPGAALIAPDEEQQRLLPMLKLLRGEMPDIPISVDTYNASTAEAAIACGADIVNDISGGMFDPDMFATVARLQVPYVLMHTTAVPAAMQQSTMPDTPDLITQLAAYFSERLDKLYSLGVADVIIDPGFGFGKTLQQNYFILNNLDSLCQLFREPLLVGVSRKSMITKLLQCSPDEALDGTTVLNTIALGHGAAILRVHDPKQAKEAVRIVGAKL